MKIKLLLLFALITSTFLAAQTQTMVVKTSGDTLYCDKITAGGKTLSAKQMDKKQN